MRTPLKSGQLITGVRSKGIQLSLTILSRRKKIKKQSLFLKIQILVY